MSFYVCGCDASGKTTLEASLAKKTNLPIIKGSSFELAKCSNEELFNHFKKIALSTKNLIVDRFAPCNVVYANKYSDYAKLTDEQFNYIMSILEVNNDVIVYVRADPEVVKHRLRQRGDEYIHEKDVDSIIKSYDNLFHNAKFKYIEIDTSTGTDPTILTDFLVNNIK
jgi:thymidylate kinase